MEAVREKQNFDEKRKEVSDRVMDKRLSVPIEVLLRGKLRTMSLASYFVCRKDPKLGVKLPNGQKPLTDPREKQKETKKL